MKDKTNIGLTSAEMSSLWSQYINDTLACCVGKYFLEIVKDEEVRPIVQRTLEISNRNLATMQSIFKKEEFPIPMGFTDEDVNLKAPRLFSDTFILMYLRQMSILAMAASAAALGLVARSDVVTFHKSVLNDGITMQDLTRELMLKQGTYIRPPFISVPNKVDFVKKQHFLAGFVGDQRALTSIEISHVFLNIQTNAIGKALITGFAQTANSKEVKDYLVRGKQLAQKHLDIFSDLLKKEDLPAPMIWDSAVTDTTENIFSDKLIMFHIAAMIAAGVGNYGMAMAASPRKDLGLRYGSLIPEISHFAEDGANLMIKHGWMEEPPLVVNRDKLIENKFQN